MSGLTLPGYVLPLRPFPMLLTITFNNISYQIRTKWNYESGCWVLEILDIDGNTLISPIALVTGIDLLEQFGYVGLGGKLICYNTQGPVDAPPGPTDLGIISQVAFIPDSAIPPALAIYE